ncbi:hypothetical protein F5050DRAFT_1876397 [Lentinula boryana]|uniref:Uncharacterized protein n=1 Tax=Lentinula boryana TaxID=40481 RepID=A0ABQ8PX50_9AGAR|nr:hypothetical protein F5050DRAFT_1876397 [Lentinula boryana]
MEQGEALASSQQALVAHEIKRQEAEEHLVALTEQVDADVEDIAAHLANVTIATHELKNLPSTPTRARNLVVSTPPVTPTHRSAINSPSPSRPPRGMTFVEETDTKNPVTPSSRAPAYVVYSGKWNQHGVFYAWSRVKGLPGAQSIYDHKFVDAGIPELLAEQQPADNERFIVIEGVKPGAYKNRKSLIMDGLQYRGGVVYRFVGSQPGAWAKFNELRANGLHSRQPRLIIILDRAGLANPLSSMLKIPGNSPMGCPNLMGCPNHLQIPCLKLWDVPGNWDIPNLGRPNFYGMSLTWDVPNLGCPKLYGMSQFLWDVPNLGCPNFYVGRPNFYGMSQFQWDVPISMGCPKPENFNHL